MVVAVLGIGGTFYFYNKSLKENRCVSDTESNKNTNKKIMMILNIKMKLMNILNL